MTNSSKLKGRMAEMGFNISSLSEAMHTSRPCLRKKINGQSEFRASEIEKVCAVLSIPLSDVSVYFFTTDVPKMETKAV